MLKTITIGFDSSQKALQQMVHSQASRIEKDLESDFLAESIEGRGINLVQVILDKGYLDVDTTNRSEYHESALTLLGKIAQCFPDTLTKLWSSNLDQALRKLMLQPIEPNILISSLDQRRVICGCKFLKEWISQYKTC